MRKKYSSSPKILSILALGTLVGITIYSCAQKQNYLIYSRFWQPQSQESHECAHLRLTGSARMDFSQQGMATKTYFDQDWDKKVDVILVDGNILYERSKDFDQHASEFFSADKELSDCFDSK